ncbi:hypothetical protein MKY66_02260 [Paenibacillus sp. FSL R5-0766]|uniref:hypothetical protein n=1 Tax=unclassified Paenibacillus TaxID=185978 RepID=UPI00096D7942|nr:hypothetical protein [Paenibacillus sp. FSL R5-0765]OMF60469.1 hypothetical protein BK141_23285 [Paenibacillus sp. FSL R5-0765]
MERFFIISNISLWIIVLIQLVFMYLLTKSMVSFINKFQETAPVDSTAVDVILGEQVPVFKGKDQRGNIFDSLKIQNSSITKLLFLSDECGTCNEVLDRLSNIPDPNKYLVIKRDINKDIPLTLSDKEQRHPIIRSTKVMNIFGVKKVPLFITLDKNGVIQGIDELKDANNLDNLLEA